MDLPSDDSLRWTVHTYARLRAAHGEAIGQPSLVLPTGEFFPDEFCGDAPSVARVLRRIVMYAPIADDLPIEIAFLDAEQESKGGCGSVACGPGSAHGVLARNVEELGDGYRIFVAASIVRQPDLLTASLARGVGAIVICEAGDADHSDTSPERAEMAAIASGLGLLLLNGAAVWAKSCGGLRMARGTALSVEETAVALALFVALRRDRESDARIHMQATQREAFDLALAWAASNPLLVETLRDRPSLLETGVFDIEPVRGPIGRWLHKRKLEKEMRVPPRERFAVSAEQKRRFEEARAVVDEVLGGDREGIG